MCVSVMFLMDWRTALATLFVISALYMYLTYRKPGQLVFASLPHT
jgi:hypothetical protein